MNSIQIQEKLIALGVANLREFGYPDCDKVTLFTDRIYSAFFKRMLEENIGAMSAEVDAQIKDLLTKIVSEAGSVGRGNKNHLADPLSPTSDSVFVERDKKDLGEPGDV